MIVTKLYSAFPGTGKSWFYENNKHRTLDSDSSKFDKKFFPQNYIDYIKSRIGIVDVMLISSHKSVRDALVENKIFFNLVYPSVSSKEEYMQRYRDRNDSEGFIRLVMENWYEWIMELKNQAGCSKIELPAGQYLSDVIK